MSQSTEHKDSYTIKVIIIIQGNILYLNIRTDNIDWEENFPEQEAQRTQAVTCWIFFLQSELSPRTNK
jgi:hypothetical protein